MIVVGAQVFLSQLALSSVWWVLRPFYLRGLCHHGELEGAGHRNDLLVSIKNVNTPVTTVVWLKGSSFIYIPGDVVRVQTYS